MTADRQVRDDVRRTFTPAVGVPVGEIAEGSILANLAATLTAVPTITPTPTATLTPTSTSTPTAYPTPHAVTYAGAITGWRGPGKEFEVVGQSEKGQELVVLGTTGNGWLWVCCISNQPAWVPPDGLSLRGVLSAAEEMPSPPTPTTAPTEPPTVTPTPSATPLPPFDIARGPEFPWKVSDDTLTIFVKVFEGPPDNQRPLGGYALRVLRDGVDLSQRQIVSHASVSGFDRTGKDDASSYSYNLKYELRNAGEADWSVALIRPDGAAVSPEWTFSTKGAARPNMAVFVAYWLAR